MGTYHTKGKHNNGASFYEIEAHQHETNIRAYYVMCFGRMYRTIEDEIDAETLIGTRMMPHSAVARLDYEQQRARLVSEGKCIHLVSD